MFFPMILFCFCWFLLSARSLTLSYDPQFFGGSAKVKKLFYGSLWTICGITTAFVVLFFGAGLHPAPTKDDFVTKSVTSTATTSNGTLIKSSRPEPSTVLKEEYAAAIGRIMAPIFVVIALLWALFCILSAKTCLREPQNSNNNAAVGVVVQVIACCPVGVLSTQGGLI